MALVINLRGNYMFKMNSIIYRITGLTFLLITITVIVLIYLANVQMTQLFQEYLVLQHNGQPAMSMGLSENHFLTSVHESLLWVGLVIVLIGLLASYVLARSITIPLRKLSSAAAKIEKGELEQTVFVKGKDEIGNLAKIFNRMSQVLATNEKLRKELLANIAHELRTPLSIIQGNLEGLIDGVIAPTANRFFSMQEEMMRLNRLVTDLRDLSLAEVHQLELKKTPTDMNKIISRAGAMMQPLADEKELKLCYDLTEALPVLMIDGDRINQVIYNILGNAIRYTLAGGEIHLKSNIRKDSNGMDWMQVIVQDNGPGIEQDDLPYVFNHFYRGEKSRNRQSGGSGIGLAIAKQFVENHNGEISVSSDMGKGTVFSILLPI